MKIRSTAYMAIWTRAAIQPAISGAMILGLGLLGAPVLANAQATFCTETANALRMACGADIEDDFWVTKAQCINVSDEAERLECETGATVEQEEAVAECDAQLAARLDVCGLVGEERYDPDFDPANFVDPNDIGTTVTANPYFPLLPGSRWVYVGGEEMVTVVVTERTKLIEGVTCRVVNDVVEEEGEVIEDTDDWYAQDLEGNVWYCGEEVQDFETFEGDDPADPEVVSIDGSFKAGRDGAKPGILMLANPQVGMTYRQEAALGEAEDVASIISITETETVPMASCTGDCLETRDFTPLEPGVSEKKYYARGVGLILEVDEEGNRTELVEFTVTLPPVTP